MENFAKTSERWIITDLLGRGDRTEFWTLFLVSTAVLLGLRWLDFNAIYDFNCKIGNRHDMFGILSGPFSLLWCYIFVTTSVRRMHDLNISGWFLLLSYFIVTIPVFMLMFLFPGSKKVNRFGYPVNVRADIRRNNLVRKPPFTVREGDTVLYKGERYTVEEVDFGGVSMFRSIKKGEIPGPSTYLEGDEAKALYPIN